MNFPAIPQDFSAAEFPVPSRDLRHPRAARSVEPPRTPVRPSVGAGGPSGPLAGGGRAWPQTPGWGHRSACGPATGRASRSCSWTWRRCRSTGGSFSWKNIK